MPPHQSLCGAIGLRATQAWISRVRRRETADLTSRSSRGWLSSFRARWGPSSNPGGRVGASCRPEQACGSSSLRPPHPFASTLWVTKLRPSSPSLFPETPVPQLPAPPGRAPAGPGQAAAPRARRGRAAAAFRLRTRRPVSRRGPSWPGSASGPLRCQRSTECVHHYELPSQTCFCCIPQILNPEGCFSFPKHTVKKKQTQRGLCCSCQRERSRPGLLSMPGLQGKERAD
ncbi:uncharacterized protein [Delphinus delphis]|uniref:uncharacterized protein n=1 Tax=Delphinus delphis TaxID=9728 RepID=UPI0028C43436|nr:uncharacterized protein LOC132419011 [Delphinus delphis]